MFRVALLIPEDLMDWRTIYEAINIYGANGFAQPVWAVTIDPEFKMNAGAPYGGTGDPTRAEVFLAAATVACFPSRASLWSWASP